MTIDAKGDVWVADSVNNRVQELGPTGTFLMAFGASGKGNGQFEEPWGMSITPPNIWWTRLYIELAPPVFNDGGAQYQDGLLHAGDRSRSRRMPQPPRVGRPGLPDAAGGSAEDGLPNMPTTTTTYNVWDEPETTTETFGATTRTKKETYDAAGRAAGGEITATTDVALPKVTLEYGSKLGVLEKQSTVVEGKADAHKRIQHARRELTTYKDGRGRTAEYPYASAENDYLLEEVSDNSGAGEGKQTYSYDETTKALSKLTDSAAGATSPPLRQRRQAQQRAVSQHVRREYTYNSVRKPSACAT